MKQSSSMAGTNHIAGSARRGVLNSSAVAKLIAFCTVLIAIFLLPSISYCAGGKPATKIYNVADTRAMEPGLPKMVADIYNSALWLYGLTVILVMAGMGFIIGFGMDKLVSHLGIDLGKLEHHE